MNKKNIYYLIIVLFATLLVACQDDVVEKPIISGIEQEYIVKQTAQLVIEPVIQNHQDATYEWVIDNNVVSKEEKLTFSSPVVGDFNGTFTVTNDGGSATTAFSVHVYGKYKYGAFVLAEGNMGNETGTLSFIDPDGVAEDSIFIKANDGEKLGNVCQDLAIANGKIYIISQNGARNGGLGKLVIADAETMKLEKVINEGLEGSTSNIAVPNSKHAFVIRDFGPMYIVDLASGTVKGEVEIKGRFNKRTPVSLENKVFAASDSKLVVIDGETTDVITQVDMGHSILGISKTAKNNIEVVIQEGRDVKTLLVDAKKYTTISTQVFEKASLNAYPNSAFCSNPNEEGSSFLQFTQNKIAILSKNDKSTFFSLPSNDFANASMFYGPIAVNPETGNIYFGYVKGWGEYKNNGVGIISPDGKLVKDYNSLAPKAEDKIDTRFCAGIYFTNPYSYKQ